ncbi:MAG: hypothetical protein AAGM36_19125 [Cyanobacteria bacterium J06597_1]
MNSPTLSSVSLALTVATVVVSAAPAIALAAFVANTTPNPRLDAPLGSARFEIAREGTTEIELLR